MTNGFDILGHTRVLQVHWLKRIAAFVVDAVLVLLPTWAMLNFVQVREAMIFGISSGFVFFIYCALFEAAMGQTPGKIMLRLRVRSNALKVTLLMAAVRSIPKFFWYLLPALDAILGLAGEGDPRQRLSDRILGTTVVQDHYLRVNVHRIDKKEEATKPSAKA